THVHTNIRGIRTGTRLNGDRSLDERTNSELLCNHRERLIGVPKRPYGRRGSHLERSHLTERRDQLIGQSIGQIGSLCFTRNELERQYRDGRRLTDWHL